MLSVSSLRDKLSFDPVKVGVGALVLASVALFLVKPPYEPTDRDPSKKPQRKIHRPETTLPLLENTLTVIQSAHTGDIHDRTLLTCRQFNAEPVLVRSIGLPDQLVVSTPEAFEDVLKIQSGNFPKGSYQCENLRDLLGDGIFAVDGDRWVHQRKTASNLFTIRALRDSMTATIKRHAVVLFRVLQRASDSGETLDLFKLFNRFTIEAFTEIGFGVHMGCLDSEEEHPFQKAFDHAQRALFLRFVRPIWFCKLQKWLGVGTEGQLKNDIDVIDKTVLDIVEKALAKRSNISNDNNDSTLEIGDNASTGKDIVSLFLGNSPDSDTDPRFLRDVVVNFLIAGRDTTAQTLSWFFLNLAKKPDVETAIRNEIVEKLSKAGDDVVDASQATMQDVSQLVYLEAALKETLRLHPPVPMVPKYVVEDVTLSDGTFVKAGSLIVLATYVMARLQEVWGPDAEEFKPERWIDPTTGKLIAVSAYKFASFNAGPRACLGMNLAMLEMKLVVAGLLSKFHVEVLNPEDVTYDLSLTLPVKGALKVNISPAALSSSPEFA
ncbi:Cytochrome P450 86A2 [Phytophthora cinnamomi]|uniref:Cytochrome P450 86A2 n=1 Tax=Phytophthora cinnamomi TaxID=4785 RepID=UPI00355A50E5|nr:Cytochrome P450 86A2 [Phytophthora cinnamomi]